MINKCKLCDNNVFKNNLCNKHYRDYRLKDGKPVKIKCYHCDNDGGFNGLCERHKNRNRVKDSNCKICDTPINKSIEYCKICELEIFINNYALNGGKTNKTNKNNRDDKSVYLLKEDVLNELRIVLLRYKYGIEDSVDPYRVANLYLENFKELNILNYMEPKKQLEVMIKELDGLYKRNKEC